MSTIIREVKRLLVPIDLICLYHLDRLGIPNPGNWSTHGFVMPEEWGDMSDPLVKSVGCMVEKLWPKWELLKVNFFWTEHQCISIDVVEKQEAPADEPSEAPGE